MLSDELHALLSLLTAMIFADKRVFAKEVESFLQASRRISDIRESDETISEAKLLSWFDENAEGIRKMLKTPDFEPWLNKRLSQLDGIYDKQALMTMMSDIANADSEFHISEQALLVLTARHWNLEYRL